MRERAVAVVAHHDDRAREVRERALRHVGGRDVDVDQSPAARLATGTWVRVYRWFMTDPIPLTWAPESCTLPTVDEPLRVAAFTALFRDHLKRVQRPAPTVAELTLDAESLDRARELATLETSCCSFFSFDVLAGNERVLMTIAVSPMHAPVLDALVKLGGRGIRWRGGGVTGTLRAGEVAERVNVNLQTLRYYERRGLLPEPDRSLGGHRLYDDDTVLLLRVIKAAQALGFTLDEIATLFDTGSHAHRRQADLHELAQAKLRQVREKIAALHEIEKTLVDVRDAGCGDLAACALEDDCPIPFAGISDLLSTDRQSGRSE